MFISLSSFLLLFSSFTLHSHLVQLDKSLKTIVKNKYNCEQILIPDYDKGLLLVNVEVHVDDYILLNIFLVRISRGRLHRNGKRKKTKGEF